MGKFFGQDTLIILIKNMTITGTSYFPSLHDAYLYYAQLNIDEVAYKIKMGEIHLGKPPLKPGETLFIKDNRYHIQGE
jgi:hypothetical protein